MLSDPGPRGLDMWVSDYWLAFKWFWNWTKWLWCTWENYLFFDFFRIWNDFFWSICLEYKTTFKRKRFSFENQIILTSLIHHCQRFYVKHDWNDQFILCRLATFVDFRVNQSFYFHQSKEDWQLLACLPWWIIYNVLSKKSSHYILSLFL